MTRLYISLPFVTFALLLVSRIGERSRLRSPTVALLCVLATVGILVEHVINFGGIAALPGAMIEIVCGFLPALLTQPERVRSFWLAILNAAIIAVGCITFSSSILVYLAFLAFIALLMMLTNIATLHFGLSVGTPITVQIPHAYFRQFAHVLPAGIAGAALIFLAFPRVQGFSLSLFGAGSGNRSGYTGMINLSGDGEISESQILTMMISSEDKDFLEQTSSTILLRGDALDTFDGTSWTQKNEFQPRSHNREQRVAQHHDELLRILTVHAEPAATDALFYPGILIDVMATSPATGELLYSQSGSIKRVSKLGERHFYVIRIAPELALEQLPTTPLAQLTSKLQNGPQLAKAPFELNARDLDQNLEIPASIKKAEWFQRWVDEVGIPRESASVAEAATILNAHFHQNFQSSLVNRFTTSQALASFISVDRQGHCEYFASAAALMWRQLGLPARVVVGYRGGLYNHLIDVLEVREENAHAWVEVFIPELGWRSFDPTPINPASLGKNIAATMRLWANAASVYFRRYVVDYDQRTQREILRSIRKLGSRSGSSSSWSMREFLGSAAGKMLLLGVAGGMLWFWIRRKRKLAASSQLPPWYEQLESHWQELGLTRETGETHAHFHQRLASSGMTPRALQVIDGALERELYANQDMDATAKQQLSMAMEEMLSFRPN